MRKTLSKLEPGIGLEDIWLEFLPLFCFRVLSLWKSGSQEGLGVSRAATE